MPVVVTYCGLCAGHQSIRCGRCCGFGGFHLREWTEPRPCPKCIGDDVEGIRW